MSNFSISNFISEVNTRGLAKPSRFEVFILPPWKEIYVSDEARYENYEQSVLIHNHLVETYTKYGYQLIEVPKDSLDNRILFILDKI